MNFNIRLAKETDLPQIMQIMNAEPSGKTQKEWFVQDEEDSVRKCLEEQGFIIVSETDSGEIAGFFIVRYPEKEENLGKYLDFTEEQKKEVVLMDSCSIRTEYRGNGLQGKMLEQAEMKIDTDKYRYFMCTIHPDNVFSLHNMQKYGYEVKKTVKCYGDNIRHVLLKMVNEQ